jgi:hypothetical protein
MGSPLGSVSEGLYVTASKPNSRVVLFFPLEVGHPVMAWGLHNCTRKHTFFMPLFLQCDPCPPTPRMTLELSYFGKGKENSMPVALTP